MCVKILNKRTLYVSKITNESGASVPTSKVKQAGLPSRQVM